MRVEQRQVKDQPLTVIVEYPEYDRSVDNLISKIKNMSISFTGKTDGKTVSIDISDIYYIENWSLGLDFKILFLTVFKGFINKNAY